MATQTRELENADRRRIERRFNHRLSDVTVPEFRRMLVTTLLFVIVAVLFLWMVRTVIIATILGVIVAMYSRPLYLRLRPMVGNAAAATVTLLAIVVPVLALLAYSYSEIKDVGAYIGAHQDEIALKINTAARKLPYLDRVDMAETIRNYVLTVSDYGTRIPGMIKSAMSRSAAFSRSRFTASLPFEASNTW